MIGIIDYDAGNIKSVEKALHYLGEQTVVSRDPQVLLHADKVILPGVGSFGDAMNNLNKFGLVLSSARSRTRRHRFLESVWGFSFCLSPVRRLQAWRDLDF